MPWKLGPFQFIDEALEQSQLVSVVVLGPEYIGMFDGERPLLDSFTAKAVILLSKFNQSSLGIQHILENLKLTVQSFCCGNSLWLSLIFFLQGIETMIVPRIEKSSSDGIPVIAAVPPDSVLMAFNSMQTGAWDVSSNSRATAGILTSPFDSQYFTAMFNVAATVAQTPVATVYNCQRISVPVSLS